MQNHLPRHVGVIMDGNGRWAKSRGMPRGFGHKQGARAFQDVLRHAEKRGIPFITVYAFSTENWKRPAKEVDGLMSLMRSYLKDMERFHGENIRVRVIGDTGMLADDIRRDIRVLEQSSADRTGMCLNIALSYGGRAELARAASLLARRALDGALDPAAIDEDMLGGVLYTAGQPDVDLIIRTGGERRLSNFLLWQSAYAEYVFTDVLWPDFTPRDFDAALEEFASRSRRMGGAENE